MAVAHPYIRWSSAEQDAGDSHRRQLSGHITFAASHGLDLRDPIVDAAVSAKNGNNLLHGKLAGFLRDVQAGVIARGDWLLVEHYDRFSRAEAQFATARFLDLLYAGITIAITGTGAIIRPGGDYVTLLEPLIKLGAAHADNVARIDRTQKAWRARQACARDQPVTARCPAWLAVVDRQWKGKHVFGGRYAVREDRAAVVREIFEQCASGIGLMMIARRLNERGISAFEGGRGWHKSYIMKLLANRALLGEYQPHRKTDGKRRPDGDAMVGVYPEIISPDLFIRAAVARLQRRGSGGRKGSGYTNLIAGLGRCSVCRGPMTVISKGQPPKGGRYIVCDARLRGRRCGNRSFVRYEPFEAALLDVLQRVLLNAPELPVNDEAQHLSRELTVLNDRVDSEKRQLLNLHALYAESPDDVLRADIDERRAVIGGLDDRLRKLREAHLAAMHRLPVADEVALIQSLRIAVSTGDYDARARTAVAIRGIVSVIGFAGALAVVKLCYGARFLGIKDGLPCWGMTLNRDGVIVPPMMTYNDWSGSVEDVLEAVRQLPGVIAKTRKDSEQLGYPASHGSGICLRPVTAQRTSS